MPNLLLFNSKYIFVIYLLNLKHMDNIKHGVCIFLLILHVHDLHIFYKFYLINNSFD